MPKKTIAVDFDGVIHRYSKGYHDGTIYNPPSEGTWDALKELSEKYKIVVLSARARTPEAIEEIGNYLKVYDLAQFITNITNIKPAAEAYIDDKAVKFSGDLFSPKDAWAVVMDKIGELKTFKHCKHCRSSTPNGCPFEGGESVITHEHPCGHKDPCEGKDQNE